MEKKPFVFGVATSGENFTDRKEETKRLEYNFKYGINTILISPRRWGKTSLVKKMSDLVQSSTLKVVHIDIFSCRSENDFYNMFASAILRQTSSKLEEWIEAAKSFLSRLSPKITFGSDPMTDFSVSFELNPKRNDVDDILFLPERIAEEKKYSIVVCIDEFQQISEFKDSKTFQKKLRSFWQLQDKVSYCLFGSKKHLMNELFERKSLPFYKFGDVVYLQKISTRDWIDYICSRFTITGKSIAQEKAEQICRIASNHSSYVQQLAWLVWVHADKNVTDSDIQDACQDILDQNTPLFEKQTESLTSYQMNFLHAVTDGVKSEFTRQEILQKYQLGTSANISAIKKALIRKELIETEKNKVFISDPIMKIWLEKEFKFM